MGRGQFDAGVNGLRYKIEWFSSPLLSSLRSWWDFGRTSAFVSVAKP